MPGAPVDFAMSSLQAHTRCCAVILPIGTSLRAQQSSHILVEHCPNLVNISQSLAAFDPHLDNVGPSLTYC